jgi:uncharacterized membrane protein
MAKQQTAEKAQETTDKAQDKAEGTADDARQTATDSGDGLFTELAGTAREAALAVLKPAVKSAAQSAASYAVDKGPDLVKDRVGSITDGGGLQDLADKALSSAGPAGKVASKLGMGGKLVDSITGGDDGEDQPADAEAVGSGRRMPVQQAIDVAVPLETAYNQWTQFEEYPNFMHRVDSASQDDETHVTFTEKVWGFGRDFEAEILEQRPNERIVWRSTSGLKHAGVVTFHQLADRLTRIEVTVDFKPESLFQKFARGARYSKRAIRADMHRFKAYIEMTEEEDGAWLGRIEDGEVVGYEEQEQEAAEDEEQPQAAGEEEPDEADEDQAPDEEEVSEEPEAEGQDEEEAADEEEPQEEEQPPPQRRRRRQPSADGSGQRAQRRRRPAAQSGTGRSRQRRSPRRPQRRQPARS